MTGEIWTDAYLSPLHHSSPPTSVNQVVHNKLKAAGFHNFFQMEKNRLHIPHLAPCFQFSKTSP